MRIGYVLGIAGVVLGGASLVWAAQEAAFDYVCAANSQELPITLVMRDRPEVKPIHFRVPVAYIYEHDHPKGHPKLFTGFSLLFNREDMSPYCLRNEKYYVHQDAGYVDSSGKRVMRVFNPPEDGDGWSKGYDTHMLSIQIALRATKKPLDPQDARQRPFDFPYEIKGEDGFTILQLTPPENDANQFATDQFLIPNKDLMKEPGYVMCSLVKPGRKDSKHKDFVPSYCQAETTHKNHRISVEYRFHRDLLPQLAQVDAEVRTIIDNYIQK